MRVKCKAGPEGVFGRLTPVQIVPLRSFLNGGLALSSTRRLELEVGYSLEFQGAIPVMEKVSDLSL